MPVLGNFKTRNNTTLNCTNFELKVMNKLPYCVLSATIQINQEYGNATTTGNAVGHTSFNGYPTIMEVFFRGLPVTAGTARAGYNYFPLPQTVTYLLQIPLQAIDFVEANRTDDVQLTVSCVFNLEENFSASDSQRSPPIQYVTADLPIAIDLSEKKWLRLLDEMGYGEKWIVELDRPRLEGFSEVMGYVTKAQEALYNKREPEDVLRDLRAARDSFKIFYDSKKVEIHELIDNGSQGEENKPAKSKRIEDIYEKIGIFLNIGPHNDKYKVSYADAQLAFREFVAILSYLSAQLSEISKGEKK